MRVFPLPGGVWLSFFIHSVIIGAALMLAEVMPRQEPAGFINPSLSVAPYIIEQFIRWDAHWYTFIAENGYDANTVVFFPGLPGLIRLLTFTGVSTATAGFAICNLCVLLSFFLLYKLFRLDYSEEITWRALLAYAVFPTSFFLNSIYTESLFLVLALASIYYARTGGWWRAGMFAAAATLTRNIGIGLFILLLYEYSSGDRRKGKGAPFVAILLVPLALLAFMAYNDSLAGDPIAFVHAQRLWGRQFGLPWDNIWENIRLIFSPGWPVVPGTILDSVTVLASLVGLLALTVSARFPIRKTYLILGWLWILVPLFSTSPAFPLYSLSRFVLIIFPLYLFIAQLPHSFYRCYILISSVLLLLCSALFINWFWLG